MVTSKLIGKLLLVTLTNFFFGFHKKKTNQTSVSLKTINHILSLKDSHNHLLTYKLAVIKKSRKKMGWGDMQNYKRNVYI